MLHSRNTAGPTRKESYFATTVRVDQDRKYYFEEFFITNRKSSDYSSISFIDYLQDVVDFVAVLKKIIRKWQTLEV